MEKILCKCGCSEELDRFDGRGRERIFIRGHNTRCLTDKQRKNLSKALTGRRFKRSKEQAEKQAILNMQRRKVFDYCDAFYDEEYKSDVRKGACERCGMTRQLSLKLWGTEEDLHHYISNYHCAPGEMKTLCKSCHAKVGSTGRKLSEETKKKISLANKGRKRTKEQRERMVNGRKIKKHVQETLRKVI